MFSEEPKAALEGISGIMYTKMQFIFGGGGQRSTEAAMGGGGRAAPHFRDFEPKKTGAHARPNPTS
jgi:hypothetical protein